MGTFLPTRKLEHTPQSN